VTFEVQSEVPIPRAGSTRKYTSKYPLRTMAVGDSFFMPVEGDNFVRAQRTVASAASRQSIKIATRRVTEDIDGVPTRGIRVWRTEDEV